jgi:hypothetical protein
LRGGWPRVTEAHIGLSPLHHIPRFLAATPEAALDGRRILEVDASPDVD